MLNNEKTDKIRSEHDKRTGNGGVSRDSTDGTFVIKMILDACELIGGYLVVCTCIATRTWYI